MRLTEEELKQLQQQRTARSARGTADCLTEDVLMRAAAKELGREERASVVRHLRGCADCAREYRIAHSLKPLAQEVALPSNPATAGLFASADQPTARPQPDVEQRGLRIGSSQLAGRFSSVRAAYAMATLLLLLSLALGWWVISLRKEQRERDVELARRADAMVAANDALEQARRELEETARRAEQEKSASADREAKLARNEEATARLRRSVAELSRPQLDIPIVDLDPASDVRGRPEKNPTEITVPGTANLFTLILNFTDQGEHSIYEIDILSPQGQKIWSGRKARHGQARNLNVTLSRRMLPENRYVIKLTGIRKGKKEPVAAYSVQVRYQ